MAKLMMVNPRKRSTRRRKSVARTVARAMPKRRRRTAARRTTARRYRRNPISRKVGIVDQLKNGAIGAAGALGVDFAFAKLPIPANLKTGMLAPATKGAVAIGLGMLIGKVGKNKKLGTQVAEGGITIALHDLMKAKIGPSMGLSGMDDMSLLGMDDSLLGIEDLGLGENVFDDLGYASAAPVYDGSEFWD